MEQQLREAKHWKAVEGQHITEQDVEVTHMMVGSKMSQMLDL
jgi:hypothetical protein